eukprot:8874208-Pyramimonas_sp.AAC.1
MARSCPDNVCRAPCGFTRRFVDDVPSACSHVSCKQARIATVGSNQTFFRLAGVIRANIKRGT